MQNTRQVVDLLSYGRVDEALELATQAGDENLVKQIRKSVAFLESAEEYESYYKSNFSGIEMRVAGQFTGGGADARQEEALQHLKRIQPVDNFLDVGCADGSFIILALDRNLAKHATGVDLWEEGVAHGQDFCNRKHPGKTSFHQVMFERFEPSVRYDAIFIGEVLEHVQDADLTLRHAKSLLAPGGHIIITVPLDRPPVTQAERDLLLSGQPNQHVRYISEQELFKMAKRTGLTVKDVSIAGQAWTSLVATLV